VFPAERVTLPSYSIVNGSVDLPLGGLGPWHAPGGLAVTGRVENVFGTTYQTVVGFPGRGRTLLMGLRIGR
jgi:outer membrane cobalamin receptor